MRRQILTGKFPTERLPNPENGQRHGYSDLGDHVVAFPNRPEAAPILVVAMNTFQPLGICPICSIGADGYIRGQQGVWALCGERDFVTILRRPKERIGTCCTTTFSKETRRWHTRTIK